MIGGIEAGGTKCVLAVGPSPDSIAATHTIPTRGPDETVADALDWFASQPAISALGLATFGPVGLDQQRPDHGHILATPKPGWSRYDFAGALAEGLSVPVAVETDVNAAALAEAQARDEAGSLAYMTVGTGIGVGLVIDGRCVHGAAHPEMGHYYPRRPADDVEFAGVCPFHGDCLEGLASGPAISARWGATLSDLPPTHPAHHRVAGYLAQACHTLFASTSVETVVLGGGVLETPNLRERIAARARELDAGYLPGGTRHTIVAPRLGSRSGIIGAMILAT
ncbi:ROK family protein [Erythrobacter sp. A6_0]|uniref:ROK family protein n=1 Tax=Erythrobacter sp. A6_0 TaxID=2821089 RepID=UPI001ADCD564|nr:ROK family protein [Erythrobacter sp. A6_0]MBO9510033.1 ROK family protein [Erythrobacter sp. A6_0]